MKEQSIRNKVFLGYSVVLIFISLTAVILFNERSKTKEIEKEANEIRKVHHLIGTTHRKITELAMNGEFAIVWNDEDMERYNSLVLQTDSMLLTLKVECKGYISPIQIDSLCYLLEQKRLHLVQLADVVKKHSLSHEKLLAALPNVTRNATETKTVTRKKSGLAGLFGGKKTETVQPSEHAKTRLRDLNEEIVSRHSEQRRNIKAYTDSLRISNGILNEKLKTMVAELDAQTQKAISSKEDRIAKARMHSTCLLTGICVISIILLLALTINIRCEMRRRRCEKERRKQLIDELQASNDKKEELLVARRRTIQSITHELRTPLTAIVGYAELVQKGADELKNIYANDIIDNARTMDGMLSYLLSYFRIANGKETVIRKPLNLANIADRLECIYSMQAETKGITFKVENECNAIAYADKDMILRIGKNLLSNALKFTPHGGIVTLRTSYVNGNFSIEVTDSGIGMANEDINRIFYAFERLSNAVDKDGFGLGLTIVKELADLMDGTIKVESVKGVGSKFWVSIPMEEIIEKDVSEKTITDKGELSINSVIVIDDSKMHRDLISEMLSLYGVKCDTCSDAFTLTEQLRRNEYDVLITDIRMSGTSGYDILHILKKTTIRKLNTLPVIAMTAMDSINEQELLEAGFSACLFKPFSIEDLMTAIKKATNTEKQTPIPDFTDFLSLGDKCERLDCIIMETKNDLQQIAEAWNKRDFDSMQNILHRLGSTWLLVKSDSPIKVLVATLKKDKTDEAAIQAAVDAVFVCGQAIIDNAEKLKEDA